MTARPLGFKARDLTLPMKVTLRPVPSGAEGKPRLTVCINVRPDNALTVSCGKRGGIEIAATIEAEIARRGLELEFATIRCLGLCEKGPNLRLAPSNSWFTGVRPGDVAELLDLVAKHIAAAPGPTEP